MDIFTKDIYQISTTFLILKESNNALGLTANNSLTTNTPNIFTQISPINDQISTTKISKTFTSASNRYIGTSPPLSPSPTKEITNAFNSTTESINCTIKFRNEQFISDDSAIDCFYFSKF